MWDELVRRFSDGLENIRLVLEPLPGFEVVASRPYLFHGAVMLLVLGIVGALVGVIVNLRSLEFNAEATVHGVFPGIVVGALYGGVDRIIPGAAFVAVFIVVALSIISRRKNTEAGTAVVLTSFYALGMVISLRKKDMSGQLEALMFGRLLEIRDDVLLQSFLVCLIAALVILVSWRRQIFFAFDRVGAQSAGLNATVVDILINTAIAAVVVAVSSAIGVLLVIGYIVIPGAAARLLCSRVSTMTIVAILIGVLGGWLGLYVMALDTHRPISPQAAVALSICVLYAVAFALRGVKIGMKSGVKNVVVRS